MIDREDLRYGDVMTYEAYEGNLSCRALALMTKPCSINVVGLSSCAIVKMIGDPPKAFDEKIEQWSEWFFKNPDKIELEWGDPSKLIGTMMTVDLHRCKDFFDDTEHWWFKFGGKCPRCGDLGIWKSLGLCCPWHGLFI